MTFLKLPVSVLVLLYCLAVFVQAQEYKRELDIKKEAGVEIVNRHGRVSVFAVPETPVSKGVAATAAKYTLTASGDKAIGDEDIKVDTSGGRIKIEVGSKTTAKRIDITLSVPERTRLTVETISGEVSASGDIEEIKATTDTGTIAVDVPTEDLKYNLQWTSSRPRYLSDLEIGKVKERSGGRFEIKGKLSEPTKNKKPRLSSEEDSEPKPLPVSLELTTARGIILLNVPPNEVSSDLRERPLTNAAKAVIRSGDSMLMDAIRRASPKYFGDYAKTLPPLKFEPSLVEVKTDRGSAASDTRQVLVRVTDLNNRAIADLKPEDFEVVEDGRKRELVSLRKETAPFNLVLLLDVSGSVDNYVNFIRKAARNFVDTVDRGDRISIITFNEDIKVLSGFTTDRARLSESLDTFDAGGGTAYYDSLAYTIVDTLRPMRGERTAVVVLSDGDDNQSFLPFDSLLGSIQESGALVYPLYVPSALIAASSSANPNLSVDPLRTRYMGLNTKAEGEGEKLAQVSGGVYYPITQLSQLQQAYDDIVVQLRSAYVLTYRSTLPAAGVNKVSPRLRVRAKRENTFVKLGPVSDAN